MLCSLSETESCKSDLSIEKCVLAIVKKTVKRQTTAADATNRSISCIGVDANMVIVIVFGMNRP